MKRALEAHKGMAALYAVLFVLALLGVLFTPSAAAQDPTMLPLPTGGGEWMTLASVMAMATAHGLAILQTHLKTRGAERARRIDDLEEEVHGLEGEAKVSRATLDVEKEARLRAELRLEGCEARCELCRHRPD